MKTLKIVKDDVVNQDINYFILSNLPDWLTRYGEHYRLLTYLSNKFNNIDIIDAGTYQGYSALALSQNIKNKIKSYDITPMSYDFLTKMGNVEIITKDINIEDDTVILNSPLILLDVDPHDGIQEKVFIDKLIKMNYSGYVLCDDIHLNSEMQSWWDSITLSKYDLTNIGHMHGTGLICFNTNVIIE